MTLLSLRQKIFDTLHSLPVLFLLAGLLFGLIFAFGTPLLWGVDETTHMARVYQLTDGQLRSDYLGDKQQTYDQQGFGGQIPVNLLQLIMLKDDNLRNPGFNEYGVGWVHDRAAYDRLGSQQFSSQKVAYSFTNTAAYAPTAYLPAVAATFVTRALHANMATALCAARITGLLFYIACVSWGLVILRGKRASLLLLAVALLPSSLYQSSIVSADAVMNSLALLFSALFIKTVFYKDRLSRLETLTLLVVIAILPTTKPTYIFLDLLVLLIPARLFGFGRFGAGLKYSALAIGSLAFLTWTYLTRAVAPTIGLMAPGLWQLDWSHMQTQFLIGHPFSIIVILLRSVLLQDNTYFTQLFGSLSFSNLQVPAISVVVSILSLVGATLGLENFRHISRRKLGLILAILLVGIVSVFATLYITFTPVAYAVVRGVQGRYFIPFLMLVLVSLAALLPVRLDLAGSRRFLAPALLAMACLSLLGSAVKFLYVIWG